MLVPVALRLQVVRALRRGVLAGDTAGLLMWRLCTAPGEQHLTAVRPSLGGLLGGILKQREPRMRLQVGQPVPWWVVCFQLLLF